MGDIVQDAIDSRGIKHVPYAEFIQEYRKEENKIYFFCEGNDDRKYYYSVIKNILQADNNDIKWYSCEGKNNVVELEKFILSKAEYSKANLLFFVDKDFDDNMNISDNIYVTNYYSIENYYTSIDTFKEILKIEYGIKENTEDFERAINLFSNTKGEFHSKITLLNAFLACQADYRKENKEATNLRITKSLNKYFSGNCLSDIVDVDLNINIHQDLQNIDTIKKIFSDAPNIESNKISEKISLFDTQNKSEVFRGKFEIKFFISFLKRFKNMITSKKNIFSQRYRCKIDIGEHDFFTALLGYVYIPDCLKAYIKMKNPSQKVKSEQPALNFTLQE